MENTKDNLEAQRYTVNDILSALMCLEDKEAKEVFTYHFKPVDFINIFNSKENFDEIIQTSEKHIEFYEIVLRGLRQLADILQVPKNFEG